MLTKTNNQNTTTLAAAMLAAAIAFTVISAASAQSRGTFDDVGDGTMGLTVDNNGRRFPVIGAGATQPQLPTAATDSFAATQRSTKPRRRQSDGVVRSRIKTGTLK